MSENTSYFATTLDDVEIMATDLNILISQLGENPNFDQEILDISISPLVVFTGEYYRFKWYNSKGSNPLDWVGLYLKTETNENPVSGTDKYVSLGNYGEDTFMAPNVPGVYEFRYFENDTFELKKKSQSFTIIAYSRSFSVTSAKITGGIKSTFAYNDDYYYGDFIGLYKETETNMNNFLKRIDIQGFSGTVTFNITTKGRYVARYISSGVSQSVSSVIVI